MNNRTRNPLAPLVISDTNLSHAWGRTLWHVVKNGGDKITPLIVSITGFQDSRPNEDNNIREALDAFLEGENHYSVEIVAFTIFPQRYWQVAAGDRHAFYQICLDALPYLKARTTKFSGNEFYFERLMKFGRGKTNENQLEYMLIEYLQNRRRTSKFQASIFDPERDQHRQPYQTFPCLQTISFVVTSDGLVVNAFYAMQYLVKRGYGNFLGLAHLGAFMAHEMGLDLAQVNVMAGVEKLDFAKAVVSGLVDIVIENVAGLEPGE